MRRTFLTIGLFAGLALACTDDGLLLPGSDGVLTPVQPSLDLVDAGHGGPVPGFWFLPPLAKQVTTEGIFDPSLQPSMDVCRLNGNPIFVEADCVVPLDLVAGGTFAPGSADVADGSYMFSWKTEVGTMDSEAFYRINIYLEDVVVGYLDINPQEPSGQSPGDDYEGLYAFRLGENLPVKFFMNPAARCATAEGYVIQCTASAVIDEDGGVVTLDSDGTPGWSRLSVVVPATALPEGYPQVTLTMERIDPDLFFATEGERCIPTFDAPNFGDCLRVTTDPVIEVPLDFPANVEMCINPTDFSNILKFDEEQDTRLQIVRYEGGVWQGLQNVDATTCPSPTLAGLVPVPEEGLLRYAALGVNSIARFVGPEPVGAHGEIRLAGSTSEFSRFRWALPGQMIPVAGDGMVIQKQEDGSENYNVPVTVRVVDAGSPDLGLAPSNVEGATVHFSNGQDVVTGPDGIASTTWTVPGNTGTATFTATALGLLDISVPDHSAEGALDFNPATLTFSATVVGVPSTAGQSPDADPPLTGTPGETLSTPLTITVYDENGEPVTGWDVTWSTTCDGVECIPGSVDGDSQTGSDGTATGTWTLSTTPGSNSATASVGGVTATWYANGVCNVIVNGEMAPGEWDCAVAAGDIRTFPANISGGEVEAQVLWQSSQGNLYFAVRVPQSSLAKANSIRFDFDNTLDGVSGDDDAINFDADTGIFTDEYLTSRCVNRSQSGCGSLDQVSQDGEGAIGNDGTWTVYELSHPLEGTPGEDFIRAAGDGLGFYLTLRSGKGAQGNTQWPGFRIFEPIIIR